MQQGECKSEDYEFSLIHGICMDKSCTAVQRIFCRKCLSSIHPKCRVYYEKDKFIDKLTELNTQPPEPKEITDLKLLTEKLIVSIKGLQEFIEQTFVQYFELHCKDQINSILQNKDFLSFNDWNNGYELLAGDYIAVPQSIMKLITQVHQVKESFDKIITIQTEGQMNLLNPKNSDLEQSEQNIITLNTLGQTQQKPLIIDAKHIIYRIALSPDGKYLATAGGIEDVSIKIWDPITGQQVGNNLNGHTDWIHSINYSKCGHYIVSGSQDQTIRQWNVSTQQQIGESIIGHEFDVTGVDYSPDINYIVSCSIDKTIRIWESKTGIEYVDKRLQHGYQICCLSLSPIINHLAFADEKGRIEIWDYERHQQSGQSLLGHTGWIHQIQYSINGKIIVSGGNDKTVRIWDVLSRSQIQQCVGHTSYIESVGLSPDMRFVISGGYNNEVRLWDSETGKEIIRAMTDHNGTVYSTSFSLDGKYIIIGGWDKQIKIMLVPFDVEWQN